MSDIITYIGPDGTVAIYRGPQSDAIEADPYADITRVLFHSSLTYIAAQEVISGTVRLTAGGYDATGKRIHKIHEHGLDYTPMVIGKVLNLRGLNYEGLVQNLTLHTGPAPFSGTLQIGSNDLPSWADWYLHKNVQLGVDDTHVTITDVTPMLGPSSTFVPYDTFDYDLEYVVAITNFPLPVLP